MEMPKPGQVALDGYDQIASELSEEAGARRVKMMGMPSLKHDGKMFLGVLADVGVSQSRQDAPAAAA